MSFIVPKKARSWVPVREGSHFPIQNLPYGLYLNEDNGEERVCVAIGDYVLDLVELADEGLLEGYENHFMDDLADVMTTGGRSGLSNIRQQLFDLLREGNPKLRDDRAMRERALIPMKHVEILQPIYPTAYVDFYSGIYHASNVGKMFRPDQPPLLPNYRWLPVGYNGRASSVIGSGEPVIRPKGQLKKGDAPPVYAPTEELDFELEMGFFLGKGTEQGTTIAVGEADEYIFGFVLVNDWSARDMQRWEYQPLGPFLAKTFATSISPWIVTLDALEPFRIPGPAQDPEPLPHLKQTRPGHFDITLEVWLQSEKMSKPQLISKSNTKHLYWSFAQQLAHQASNGTNLEPSDLYASGTISGPDEGSFGSMLELCWKGTKPITLEETGETRIFLADGDVVTMTGYCEGDGYRVGFGEVSAKVMPAS
ncbi:MAG TPA: fumarylacetoacetase [Fimbriimonadaceae bacterium]|nr:fumarylacetoacetase [Fimbriimonadaceae bacterium]